jgi:hypothetical protein
VSAIRQDSAGLRNGLDILGRFASQFLRLRAGDTQRLRELVRHTLKGVHSAIQAGL